MNIKELRLSTGMTQQEFADYFNIPKRTIENWESDKRNPPVYVVELIEYKIEKEILIMTKQETMQYVDTICDENGYEDGPAYDLIYSKCCEGRSIEDAKSLINEMLENYNK